VAQRGRNPAPADRLDEQWLPKLQETARQISSALGHAS
jgi:hypothetical protein